MELTVRRLTLIAKNNLLVNFKNDEKIIGKIISYRSLETNPSMVASISVCDMNGTLTAFDIDQIDSLEELVENNPTLYITEC